MTALVKQMRRLAARVAPALLRAFRILPPSLRGAGATSALGAVALTTDDPLVALGAIGLWLCGLLFELFALPRLERDGDGVPDALAEAATRHGFTTLDVRLLMAHAKRVGLERALDALSRQRASPEYAAAAPDRER